MPAHSSADARPAFPIPAISWLTGSEAVVLDFAAGTGRVTQSLVDLDHEVYAVHPVEAPLARLRERLPDVPTAIATVGDIPLPDDSLEVVVWAEPTDELAEALAVFARVLKPGAIVALAWNVPDQRIPWVRRMTAILESPERPPDVAALVADGGLFTDVETETFAHWQQLDGESLAALALSFPHIARRHAKTRARILRDLATLYDEYERGIDGLRLPYLTHCFRLTCAIPLDSDEAAPEPPLIDFS